ncbi:MAG: FAD-binding oxidoreductase [Thermodesulfobacteriota bacterium]|nr:FAD-binding oxidoreductase [Thermodesulfobacteriota bacterium]
MEPEVRHHEIYDLLCEIVGSDYVADDDFAKLTYSCDAGIYPGISPGIIVRPKSSEEVADIIKLANRTGTPVIPRGGGASLFGFPRGEPGRSIVIDLTRMDEVINIDEKNRIVTVEAGTTCSKLATIVKRKGYHLPTVWFTYYYATIGGLLAGVVGGGGDKDFASIGATGDIVNGFKVVLPNGDIIQTGSGPGTNTNQITTFTRNCPGPDLTGLFINSCGMFGVITEATLQLFPIPRINEPGSFLFDNVDSSWQAIYSLMHRYPIPYSSLIGISPEGVKIITGEEIDKWAFLYAVRGDSSEEVSAKHKMIETICKDAGGTSGSEITDRVAQGAVVTAEVMRETPSKAYLKGAVATHEFIAPAGDLLQLYKTMDAEIKKRYTDDFEKYHLMRRDYLAPWGRGVIFGAINIYYDAADLEAVKRVAVISREVNTLYVKLGAFLDLPQGYASQITAFYFSPTYFNFLRTLKSIIDPNNIMCPGIYNL